MSEIEQHFPHAPASWTPQEAIAAAQHEGVELGDDHWQVIKALQDYFARHADHPVIHPRDLHDALDEKFHFKGGLGYLYRLFPGGPVAQGCRIAGLAAPAGSTDRGYGSVA